MFQSAKFSIIKLINKLNPVTLTIGSIAKSDRDEQDVIVRESIKANNITKSRNQISAVYRVKNGGRFLESSILSIAPLCTEIIVVDNNSTDNTKQIVDSISLKFKGVCEIKYFIYDNELSPAGRGYYDKVKINPESSLAKFYNFAFSKASCEYIMKVDAHLIYLPSIIPVIQKKLERKPKIVKYGGRELYGLTLGLETYIFRKDLGVYFEDEMEYEVIHFNQKISKSEKLKSYIFKPAFIHIKRLAYVDSIK
ncbi:glycosyltransferase family 2 protein [Vibrio owensii]|uniref:glycosyltransferase family 2 protein n=1 Tax=Vibrio owensii TaxID=696485 RepID=UPI0003A1CE55|nr:glycosyltransferase [Vibrio owensii]